MDFIKKKVILRSVIASFAPIIYYTLGRICFRFFKPEALEDLAYFNPMVWTCIFATAILYPISQISLWFFFKPIEMIFDSNLKIDPKKVTMLKGNFAPIKTEMQYEMHDNVIGKVPEDINGVFLRNGPNPKYLPKNNRYHWFDGDSMIHAVRIKDGKIWYCNKYTQTPRLQLENKYGSAQEIRAGELFMGSGLFKVIMHELQKSIGYKEALPELGKGQANTAFTNHAKRTYALLEADLPFHIKLDESKALFDIKSIGYDDFGGQLDHAVSAHPKIDRKTGEMLAYGYDLIKKCIHFSVINKDRKVTSQVDIPIGGPRMIHDFMITENYCIFPDLPLEMKPECVFQGKFIFAWDKTIKSRFGVMKRHCQDPSQVQWFELPNHYVFHYVNAWEETNDLGEVVLTAYGPAQEEVTIDLNVEHPFADAVQATMSRFEFNLTTGKATYTKLCPELSMEFPTIDLDLMGYKNRYTWVSIFKSKRPQTLIGIENAYFEAVIKYDLLEEKVVGRIDFGETCSAGEIFYEKKENATSEDDGYLMSFVYDYETGTSNFIMWDAKNMIQEPLLKAQTKERVPNGFHGLFVKEEALEK